jgi:xanthine dehydrogenase accessory factor
MKQVLEAIVESLRHAETIAVLTVVRASGSTPRPLSSNMLVRADGTCVGSIGGGTMELQAIQDARAAMSAGQPSLVEYNLNANVPGTVGLCGGTAQVFIDVLSSGRK